MRPESEDPVMVRSSHFLSANSILGRRIWSVEEDDTIFVFVIMEYLILDITSRLHLPQYEAHFTSV